MFHHSEKEPGDDPQSWSEPSWYHGEPYRQLVHQGVGRADRKRSRSCRRRSGPRLVRGPPFEAADEPDDVYPDGQTAAKAIETLRRLKEMDKPFFLGVGFVKPHLPFTCPQKYWDMYPADTIKLPDNYYPPKNVPEPALHNWYELRTYGGIPAKGGIPDETALNLIRGYRACISFMDVQVGRVLDELDRLGLRENTIVVFLGDHGYHLGENGIFTKMTNFELGTHAPLIVSVPGRRPPDSARARSWSSWTSTRRSPNSPACRCRRISKARASRRCSTIPRSRGRRRPSASISGPARTSSWAAPCAPTAGATPNGPTAKKENAGVELYDEQDDPAENVNVAGETANQSVVDEMAASLHAGWRGSNSTPLDSDRRFHETAYAVACAIALAAGVLLPPVLRAETRPEATANHARAAVQRSLPYLEKVGTAWMTEKKCNSCHVVTFLVWSHHEALAHGIEVDRKKLSEWVQWSLADSLSDRHWFKLRPHRWRI